MKKITLRPRLAGSVLIFFFLLVIPVPAFAAQWTFETLDGHQDGPNGQLTNSMGSQNSAPLLYAGQPHVWYQDSSAGNLRHAWWNGSNWTFETLDGHQSGPRGEVDSNVGGYPSATIYNGEPHVWYYDVGNQVLRHAWFNPTTWWTFETLDGHQNGPQGQIQEHVGAFSAVTIYNGEPHVWYQRVDTSYLRHAWWNGSAWFFETLDGHQVGPRGQTDATLGIDNAATVFNGEPHVWYRETANQDLRHGWFNVINGWTFETLDGHVNGDRGQIDASVGAHSDVTIFDGGPHVWHRDNTGGNLRHAWWNPIASAWTFETLDGNVNGPTGQQDTDVGASPAVTLFRGEPHVWYLAPTDGFLRHGWWNGSQWTFETLDGHQDGPSGQTTNYVGVYGAALIYQDQPHVWYRDSSLGDLRHSWYG